jgi:juvenile hormone-III synthase
MINAKLYSRNNCAQRKSANDLLKDFAHHFNWPIDRNGRLLDIGTGSADVLMDLVVPKIPENAKAFGSDISIEMVNFARKTFENESVTFYQADISADYEILRKKIPGTFDNITSFFCLHWIQNQRSLFCLMLIA